MAKKVVEKTNPSEVLKVLDHPPEGEVALLVKNISNETWAIGHDRFQEPDFALGPQAEKVVDRAWAKNRFLRDVVQSGALTCSWVDPDYRPRRLPDPNDAPAEIVEGLTSYERAFAQQIAQTTDVEECIRLIQTDGLKFGMLARTVDTHYMKTRFSKLLDLTEWLEKQMQNRPRILKAIEKRREEIRKMMS